MKTTGGRAAFPRIISVPDLLSKNAAPLVKGIYGLSGLAVPDDRDVEVLFLMPAWFRLSKHDTHALGERLTRAAQGLIFTP